MSFREYLGGKGVWVDGLCWSSYSQSAGNLSEIDYIDAQEPATLYIHERYGRFGNNIHQLLNSLVIARALSLKIIDCKFYIDEERTKSIFIDDMVINFGINGPPRAPYISATMFYVQGFEKFIADFSYDTVKRDAEKLYRALFAPKITEKYDANRNVVVFHFRSGDIFSTDINPLYTQPPLSYYVKALDHICETITGADLRVVYENKLNPCIDKFCNVLDERGLKYKTQSSSFKADAGLLASADCVVSSYSSFCDALALMNDNLKRWYAFRAAAAFECVDLSISSKFSSILQSIGAEIYLVDDEEGLYIPMGGWKNTPEQIRQLTDYPTSKLCIKPLQ
ncbi:hypothetical protein [Methylobacterium fujisawaense]|uniref:hypothetical protein n=1 Tax=Methylobacterium fujisawaense TaxID=107400 RepID=UPI002F351FDE